jgi:glycosyltransferase involved in cell wall biosynthesis
MKIAFLLGSPDISGGTNVIFEHASRMQKFGHEVTILTESTVAAARYAWHPDASLLVWRTIENASNTLFDCILATWWQSVFFLARLRSRNFVYFVQSIESRFFPAQNPQFSELRDIDILAEWCENTYRYPLPIITEASWIQRYIFDHFHREAKLAVNGIRKDLFNTEGLAKAAREPGKLRVLVEGPFGVFYKNVEKTISLCLKAEVEEIWLLTSTQITSFPGVDRCFSRIPIGETSEIYRSCDVLVKLSSVEGMFGPPLEMFHCGGTAIVYDVTGHEEYIEDGKNAIVVKKDNEHDVVSWLKRFKSDPDFLEKLKKGAIATAAGWLDWDQASRKFEESLIGCCSRKDEISTSFLEEHNTHFLAVRENAFSARSLERLALREGAAVSSSFVNFMQVYCDCGAGIMGELTDRYESGEWSICRVCQKNVARQVRVRIDPSVRIGIVAVRSIRIIGEHSGAVIASWKDGDGWEEIDIAGTAVCLRRKPYPVLETYGEDPQMVLPLLRLPEGEEAITIEIELREMGFAQAFAQYSSIHEGRPKGVKVFQSIFRYLRSLRSRYI